MKQKSNEQKVKNLIGNYLLPIDTTIRDLKLELADLLVFKERLDIEFGDFFEVEKLTSCTTIEEIINYVVETVSMQNLNKDDLKLTEDQIDDDIGFLIIELANNDTNDIGWEELPPKIQSLFSGVVNEGIDKSKASISHKKDELYIFNYIDAGNDFSASYIIHHDKVIFVFEN